MDESLSTSLARLARPFRERARARRAMARIEQASCVLGIRELLVACTCMHPPLDRPHPHCQAVITALRTCHAENPLSKLVGVCNDEKWALDACFKAEKEVKRKENHEKAKREAARLVTRRATSS